MSTTPDNLDSRSQPATSIEQRFRALANATSDVVYSLSADWRVMYELDGRGFLANTDKPTTDWQSKNVYPGDQEIVTAAIIEAIRSKSIFQLEHRVNTADGSVGWTFSRAVPIFDDEGEIIEWLGMASDITSRKLVEAALDEAREKAAQQKRLYETVTSNTPDLMYVFDLEYRFTYANEALLNMWGKTWENSVGKGLLENGYEPWHAEMHEREIDRVRATKQSIRGEVSFPHAFLGRRIYDYIFTPVFDESGNVEAVAGTTRDVTERKQWEESLARSSTDLRDINEKLANANEEQAASNEELRAINEELAFVNEQLLAARQRMEESKLALRLAVNAANFGTWFIHSTTREFIVDARLKELFGYYPGEDLTVEQALAQITDEYRSFVADRLENAIYNNGDYDVTYPVIGLHDNRLRWLRAIGNLKADPSGTFSAFTGVVMDITEPYLAAKKVELAQESLRMAIEAAGLATFYINATDRVLAASPKFKELFGFLQDEDVPFEAMIKQIHPDYRLQVAALLEAAFNEGNRFDAEYPIICRNDDKLRWVRGIGAMQHNQGVDYLTGVLHEITEKKLDELRKNDFIGMVSHELKTPLTSLTAIVQLASTKLKNSDDAFLAGAMGKANVQVKRMAVMINGFLNVSRLDSGKISIDKKRFDMAKLIKESEEETVTMYSSHKIIFAPVEETIISADQGKIGQVINNFISNAVKYSKPGSTVNVACVTINGFAVVSVNDEGIGIKKEEITRILERYYRVEGNSHISGFGIGLYLSAEIIERHQGQIWAESEPGKGSAFYFSLPVADKQP